VHIERFKQLSKVAPVLIGVAKLQVVIKLLSLKLLGSLNILILGHLLEVEELLSLRLMTH
jgi:hypothetical protein